LFVLICFELLFTIRHSAEWFNHTNDNDYMYDKLKAWSSTDGGPNMIGIHERESEHSDDIRVKAEKCKLRIDVGERSDRVDDGAKSDAIGQRRRGRSVAAVGRKDNGRARRRVYKDRQCDERRAQSATNLRRVNVYVGNRENVRARNPQVITKRRDKRSVEPSVRETRTCCRLVVATKGLCTCALK